MVAKTQVPMGYHSSKVCCRHAKFGRDVKDIKTYKKVTNGKPIVKQEISDFDGICGVQRSTT